MQGELALHGEIVAIAGVDEAGRGPLAGPVYAAAVILDPRRPVPGLADSKKIAPRVRLQLAQRIRDQALACAVARVDNLEIDRINILNASMAAMASAVASLTVTPDLALIDGNRVPPLVCAARAVVGGDASEPCISAASILAKVARDEEMLRMDQEYPGYGFAVHKGYPTAAHIAALERLGACAIHRRTFAPVRRVLERSGTPVDQ